MDWRPLFRKLQRLSGGALARLGVALALVQFALVWLAVSGADAVLGRAFDAIALPHPFSPFNFVAFANVLFCALAGLIQGVTARRIMLEWHWRRYRQAQLRCLAAGAFYLLVAASWMVFSLLALNSVPPALLQAKVCVERDFFAAALTLLLPASGFFLASFGFSRNRHGAPEAEF